MQDHSPVAVQTPHTRHRTGGGRFNACSCTAKLPARPLIAESRILIDPISRDDAVMAEMLMLMLILADVDFRVLLMG